MSTQAQRPETPPDPETGSGSKTPGAPAAAIAFLRIALASGERPATDVQAEAEAAGISTSGLRQAREELAETRQASDPKGGRRWLWKLKDPIEVEDAPLLPPHKSEAHLHPDWLPTGTGLDWIEDLRSKHVELVTVWLRAVHARAAVDDRLEAERRSQHDRIKAALQAGKEPPTPGLDVVAAVEVELADERVYEALEQLSECVVHVLAELRARRPELEPVWDKLSPALKRNVDAGVAGDAAREAEQLRRRLAELSEDGAGGIEVLTDEGGVVYA